MQKNRLPFIYEEKEVNDPYAPGIRRLIVKDANNMLVLETEVSGASEQGNSDTYFRERLAIQDVKDIVAAVNAHWSRNGE